MTEGSTALCLGGHSCQSPARLLERREILREAETQEPVSSVGCVERRARDRSDARVLNEKICGGATVRKLRRNLGEHVISALRQKGPEAALGQRRGQHVSLLLVIGCEVAVIVLSDLECAGDTPLQRCGSTHVEEVV